MASRVEARASSPASHSVREEVDHRKDRITDYHIFNSSKAVLPYKE